jgi:hypothetical protein
MSNNVLSVELDVSLLTLEDSIIMTDKATQSSESMHRARTVTSRNDDGGGANEEEYPSSSRIFVIAIIPKPNETKRNETKRNYQVKSTVLMNLLDSRRQVMLLFMLSW